MHRTPFEPDPRVAARLAELEARLGGAVTARLATLHGGRHEAADAGDRGVVRADEVEVLVRDLALEGVEELMLLALPFAATLARPAVSGYVVGAVGLDAGTGELLLGGNVEFAGTSLGLTLHGEGAVALRAVGRGASLRTLAVTRARPCAHCRQVLAEHAWGEALRIIDPLGHAVTLADLYPWPFSPAALGRAPLDPGAAGPPALSLAPEGAPPAVTAALVAAGGRAHAPYSGVPAACVVELPDGRLLAGAALESVAYNPSIGPLQAAIPELIARGHELSDIRRAWLAVPRGSPVVDHVAVTRHLLGAVAPAAPIHIVTWA